MAILNFRKTLLNLFLASSFLWVSYAYAQYSPDFWADIHKELLSKKNEQNWSAKVIRRGDKYYYLNKKGDIVEATESDILDWVRKMQSKSQGLSRRTFHKNKKQRAHHRNRAQSQMNNMHVPGLGVVAYSQDAINSYYKSLRKKPSEIIVDTEKGIAFFIDDQNLFQVKPLNDIRHLVHPLQKGRPFSPKGQPFEPIEEEPQENHAYSRPPKDMLCKAKEGKKISANKNVMASSAQLSVIKPTGKYSKSIENCNAWKVSENQIMTNAHCIESFIKVSQNYCQDNPRSCTKLLRRKIGKVSSSKIKAKFFVNGKAVNVLCGRLNAANRSLDYAVLSCRNMPKEIPIVRMATKRPSRKTNMTLATWDFKTRGNRQVVQKRTGKGKVINRYGSDMKTNIKIKSGNSGSVLYNSKTLEAVGLVHSKDADGRTYSKGYFTSVSDIMSDLKRTAPQHEKKIRLASGLSKVKCEPAKDLFIGEVDDSLPTSIAQ